MQYVAFLFPARNLAKWWIKSHDATVFKNFTYIFAAKIGVRTKSVDISELAKSKEIA